MIAYSNSKVKELVSTKLKNWSFDGTYLIRSFKFRTFVSAFAFMTGVALEAEKAGHHPEWSNIYNNVTIKLNTHDVNGITQLDFDLAKAIDSLIESYRPI